MKKTTIIASLLAIASLLHAGPVKVETPNISLILNADKGKAPEYVYFGKRLANGDADRLQNPRDGRMNAYPAYGLNAPAEAALAMRHSDGNMSTDLIITDVSTSSEGNSTVTTISMKDPAYAVTVDLNYRAYRDVDIIEAWTAITNNEKSTVTLTTFASAMLPIRRGDVWLSHLYGSWGNEARLVEEPLNAGQVIIKNKDGVRNSHTDHAEVMLSLDGKGRENEGDVIGAALCYSGNYRIKVETDDTEYHYLFAGILHHPAPGTHLQQ